MIEIKNNITAKNALSRLMSRLNAVKERNSKLQGMSIEMSQTELQVKKE